MTRDMTLVREILQRVEESEGHDLEVADFQREQWNDATILYHLELLVERLTWEGHEFLAAARNEKVWDRVARDAQKQSVSLPFQVLKTLLVEGTKALLTH